MHGLILASILLLPAYDKTCKAFNDLMKSFTTLSGVLKYKYNSYFYPADSKSSEEVTKDGSI